MVSANDSNHQRRLEDGLCNCECHVGDDGYDASQVTYGVFQYSDGDDDIFTCLPAGDELDTKYAEAYDPNGGLLGYCDDSCVDRMDDDDVVMDAATDDEEEEEDDEEDDEFSSGDVDDNGTYDDDLADADDDDSSASTDQYVQFFDHSDCECECASSTRDHPSVQVIVSDPFNNSNQKTLCASDDEPIKKESTFEYSCDWSCEEDEGRRNLRKA